MRRLAVSFPASGMPPAWPRYMTRTGRAMSPAHKATEMHAAVAIPRAASTPPFSGDSPGIALSNRIPISTTITGSFCCIGVAGRVRLKHAADRLCRTRRSHLSNTCASAPQGPTIKGTPQCKFMDLAPRDGVPLPAAGRSVCEGKRRESNEPRLRAGSSRAPCSSSR